MATLMGGGMKGSSDFGPVQITSIGPGTESFLPWRAAHEGFCGSIPWEINDSKWTITIEFKSERVTAEFLDAIVQHIGDRIEFVADAPDSGDPVDLGVKGTIESAGYNESGAVELVLLKDAKQKREASA